MSGQKPRQIAARVLARRSTGVFVEDLFDSALAVEAISPVDRRLCHELVYGCVRWQAKLDWLIGRKTQNRTQKEGLQNLLRLGLYQIFWLDRIPNHAAVHETVELAKHSGFGAQAGFVNALLRGYLREFDASKRLLEDLKSSHPAIGYSHPQWLVDRWVQHWGADQTSKLLEWDNQPPATFARVNTLKTSADKLLMRWREEEVVYDFVRRDWLEENLVFELKNHPPLSGLPSFQDGSFYIQDPSTLLAVHQLAPQPGETILDFCAAPGGKLSYIAQLMHNDGVLVAQDTYPERIKLLEENCTRLGITCARLVSAPARVGVQEQVTGSGKAQTQALQVAQFDKILIDAPCSNTGVMRRRVDLRWRLRPEEIGRLRREQLALLHQAAPLLKPGGTLVYSTCSLEPEENRQVVQAFLSEENTFTSTQESQVSPFKEAVDGAFSATLQRSGPP